MTQRFKVQINYRSRNSMVFECSEFKINRFASGLQCEWADAKPDPLLIGMDDIESVWQLDGWEVDDDD